MRKAKRRALVVGGSMSGLLAALLLRRAGWDVEVFERVERELAGRGAGIVAQPDLIETLRRLGIDPTDLGVEISSSTPDAFAQYITAEIPKWTAVVKASGATLD